MKKLICMLCALLALRAGMAPAQAQSVSVAGRATAGAVFTAAQLRYVPVTHAIRLNVTAEPADDALMLIDAQVNPEPDADAEAFDGTLVGLVCEVSGAVNERGESIKRSARIKPERDGAGMAYAITVNLDPQIAAQEAMVTLDCAVRETADREIYEERTGEGQIVLRVPLEAALAQTTIALDEEISTEFCVSGARYDREANRLSLYVDVNPNDMLSALADLELGLMEKDAEQLRKETLRLGEPAVGIVCDVASFTDNQGEEIYAQFSQTCVRAVRGLAYELVFDLKRPLQGETVTLDLIAGVSGELNREAALIRHIPVTIPIL